VGVVDGRNGTVVLVAAAEHCVELRRLSAVWVDTLGARGEVLRLLEGDTQTLGPHGRSALLYHHVPVISKLYLNFPV